MGKLIYFPCVDHYEEWQYGNYYEKENYYLEEFDDIYMDQNYEDDKGDGFKGFKGFVKRLLLFILMRL